MYRAIAFLIIHSIYFYYTKHGKMDRGHKGVTCLCGAGISFVGVIQKCCMEVLISWFSSSWDKLFFRPYLYIKIMQWQNGYHFQLAAAGFLLLAWTWVICECSFCVWSPLVHEGFLLGSPVSSQLLKTC